MSQEKTHSKALTGSRIADSPNTPDSVQKTSDGNTGRLSQQDVENSSMYVIEDEVSRKFDLEAYRDTKTSRLPDCLRNRVIFSKSTGERQRLRFRDKSDPTGKHSWSVTNPNYQPLHDALWNARYSLKSLTQTQAYLICAAAEDLLHFLAHPAPTKSIIDQLREIRREVKRREKD